MKNLRNIAVFWYFCTHQLSFNNSSVVNKFRVFAVLVIALLIAGGCKFFGIDAFSGSTLIWESGANNYFNREKPTALPFAGKILITGEVEKDHFVNTSGMPWHSVTIKEYAPSGDSMRFEGAFRYDGYALCDILSTVKVNKLSKEDFYPPVDLYVEIWNNKGEYTVFSWGEIFYSADPYKVILAKSVSRVIPGKTGELWSLPEESKVVAGNDLVTVRNISDPIKIVIKSLKGDFKVNRDPEIFTSAKLTFGVDGDRANTREITSLPADLPVIRSKSVYYGQSMGYKGEKEFEGVDFGLVMKSVFPANHSIFKSAIVCVEGIDGYRAAFSFSEIVNRSDYREPLLMTGGSEKGRDGFSLFCRGDMFADRAVKGLSKITVIR